MIECADTTTLNPDEPIFKDTIPSDAPRRQMDRRLLESIDADHRRVREISNRLIRLESLFEQIGQNIARLDQQQRIALGCQEQTATSMAAISNKLTIHTEMEEYQWTVVNKSNDSLELLNRALQKHLQDAEGAAVRLSSVEKMTWALWGVVGAAVAALIPLVLKGLGVG